MAKNENLHKAKEAKNDEFYTGYDDIQIELNHYENQFKGKTVLCNCDDPFESNFCKFFLRNFNYLGLKRLICTSYNNSPVAWQQMTIWDYMGDKVAAGNGHGYVMDITAVPMANGRGVSDADIDKLLKSKKNGVKKLKGDGDFRSDECIEYLTQADIVVTNPPFSLFRSYVAQLMEYNKQFLIIGNMNAITYKEIFPLLKDNKIWLGYNQVKVFKTPDGTEKKFGNIIWYTNLDIEKRHEKLILYKRYYGNEENYPKYDNYDAINVDKVTDIPCDYFENIGVPITFVKFRKGDDEKDLTYTSNSAASLNRTEQNRTEQNRTEQNRTEDYSVLQNYHQKKAVTELWESQLPSSINIAQINLKSSDLQLVTSGDSLELNQNQEKTDHILEENYDTAEYSSRQKCSGIMGVPITFLDKYNPEQFEIIGLTQRGCHDEKLELKKYDDYWECRPDGTRTGSSGTKTNGNPNIAMNDKTHNYFINKNGNVIQSCYQRVLIKRRTNHENRI